MKKVKGTRFLDVFDGYFISNTGDVSIDEVSYDECYNAPPIRMYYADKDGVSQPIDESIERYCSLPDYWRETDVIGNEGVTDYKFLKKNSPSIIRGEIDEWHLFGVDITPYATILRFITINYDMYHLKLSARRKKLHLLFELEASTGNTEEYLCSIWNTLWRNRKTRIIKECDSSYDKIVMSEGLFKRYENAHPNLLRFPVKIITCRR